jgi:hypothetical protein
MPAGASGVSEEVLILPVAQVAGPRAFRRAEERG